MKNKNIKIIIISFVVCIITCLAVYCSVKSHIEFFWILSAIGFFVLIAYIGMKGFGSTNS